MAEKRKILFYGDSNTYGFDPRGFICDRYPEDVIWKSLAAKALGDEYEVINRGMNGRRLPVHEESYAYIKRLIGGLTKKDLFAVMLGSNDLLVTLQPDSSEAVNKMERLVQWILRQPDHPRLLILAPPHIEITGEAKELTQRYYDESVKMNEGFADTARTHGVFFADTGLWHVPLAYDGVHLSEEGHKKFADEMLKLISDIL